QLSAGVVDPNERPIPDQELVDAPADLNARQRLRTRRLSSLLGPGRRCWWRSVGIVTLPQPLLVTPRSSGCQVHRNRRRLARQNDAPLQLATDALEIGGQIGIGRTIGDNELKSGSRDGSVGTRRPRQHFDDQLIFHW